MTYIVNMKLPFKVPYDIDLIEDVRAMAQTTSYKFNYGIDLTHEYVSDVAISFFQKHGYNVVGAEYFYFDPNVAMDIHIDGSEYCRKAKFNWAWGGDHTFRFFEPIGKGVIDFESTNPNKDTTQKGYSWEFTEDNVTLQQQAPIGTPSMCCVGVPHQVINGDQPLELFNITVWKRGLTVANEDLGGMDMEIGLEDFKQYVL